MKNILLKGLFISFISFLWIPINAQAFSVSPSKIELDSSRGLSENSLIRIINTSDVEQKYYLSTLKFKAYGENGEPNFIPHNEDHEGFPEWISFAENNITLEAGEVRDIDFSVNIPPSAESGGHYAAVTVSLAPSDLIPNGATVQAKTAVLLLLNIEGKNTVQAGLLDFKTDETKIYWNRPPIDFSWRLQNQGNVHISPTGIINIYNIFGRNIETIEINEDAGNVLPLSTREFNESWHSELSSEKGPFLHELFLESKYFSIGKHTAELKINCCEEGGVINEKVSFYLFPWRLCLISVIMFLTGLLLIVLGKKAYRKR